MQSGYVVVATTCRPDTCANLSTVQDASAVSSAVPARYRILVFQSPLESDPAGDIGAQEPPAVAGSMAPSARDRTDDAPGVVRGATPAKPAVLRRKGCSCVTPLRRDRSRRNHPSGKGAQRCDCYRSGHSAPHLPTGRVLAPADRGAGRSGRSGAAPSASTTPAA